MGEQIGRQSADRTGGSGFTTVFLFVKEQTSVTAAAILDPDLVRITCQIRE